MRCDLQRIRGGSLASHVVVLVEIGVREYGTGWAVSLKEQGRKGVRTTEESTKYGKERVLRHIIMIAELVKLYRFIKLCVLHRESVSVVAL